MQLSLDIVLLFDIRLVVKVLIPSPVKPIQAPQSKHIADDDEDEWELLTEYATNHQQAMDAHDIVDDMYRHAKKLCMRVAW